MNDRKRARLGAICVLLAELRDEESQDLKDTPDNIENSGASDDFRFNILCLDSAITAIKVIK